MNSLLRYFFRNLHFKTFNVEQSEHRKGRLEGMCLLLDNVFESEDKTFLGPKPYSDLMCNRVKWSEGPHTPKSLKKVILGCNGRESDL